MNARAVYLYLLMSVGLMFAPFTPGAVAQSNAPIPQWIQNLSLPVLQSQLELTCRSIDRIEEEIAGLDADLSIMKNYRDVFEKILKKAEGEGGNRTEIVSGGFTRYIGTAAYIEAGHVFNKYSDRVDETEASIRSQKWSLDGSKRDKADIKRAIAGILEKLKKKQPLPPNVQQPPKPDPIKKRADKLDKDVWELAGQVGQIVFQFSLLKEEARALDDKVTPLMESAKITGPRPVLNLGETVKKKSDEVVKLPKDKNAKPPVKKKLKKTKKPALKVKKKTVKKTAPGGLLGTGITGGPLGGISPGIKAGPGKSGSGTSTKKSNKSQGGVLAPGGFGKQK